MQGTATAGNTSRKYHSGVREETRKTNVYFMSLFSYHWLYILILFCIMWIGVYDTTLYGKKPKANNV